MFCVSHGAILSLHTVPCPFTLAFWMPWVALALQGLAFKVLPLSQGPSVNVLLHSESQILVSDGVLLLAMLHRPVEPQKLSMRHTLHCILAEHSFGVLGMP